MRGDDSSPLNSDRGPATRSAGAEAELMEFLKRPGLTVEALRRFQERFTH